MLELELDIPDSRELRVTLPPDAPTGRVKVTLSPVAPPPNHRPTHPKLAREHDAFVAMRPALLAAHRGRYVAIHDGQVIGVGDSSVAVLTAAEKSHPGSFPLVLLVSDQSLPRERWPSIRSVRG